MDVLPNSPNVRAGIDVVMAVCVYVAIPCTPDVRFVDVPAETTHEEGHTGFLHFHPSFCGACLNFSREKNSAVPFPRRP